jgi:hypothetical protein
MANNPINLAFRFLLELVGLFAFGYWGWTQHGGVARWGWTLGLPLAAAAAWGIFRVPGDPKEAVVAVPGFVRLLLEAVYFGLAIWAFYAAGQGTWGLVFGISVLIHYLVSYDRILWLIKQ